MWHQATSDWTSPVGRLLIVDYQPHHGCVICKLEYGVWVVNGGTAVCTKWVEEQTENTALGGANVEDDVEGGDIFNSDITVGEKVLDPFAEVNVSGQVTAVLVDGAKSWTEVNKQHPAIGVGVIQVRESSEKPKWNDVISASVGIGTGLGLQALDIVHYQSLKVFKSYWY